MKDVKELEASLGPDKSTFKQFLKLVREDSERTLAAQPCESCLFDLGIEMLNERRKWFSVAWSSQSHQSIGYRPFS